MFDPHSHLPMVQPIGLCS